MSEIKTETVVQTTVEDTPSVIPEQLNYERLEYAAPKYKYSRLVPLSGGQTFPVPLSTSQEVLFEVPVNVANLSESILSANISISRQGDGRYAWWHTDGMPIITNFEMYTRSGVELCKVPHFNKYMKIVRKIFTPLSEYKTNDPSTWMYPSKVEAGDVPAITPNNGQSGTSYDENAYVMSSVAMGQGANTQINLVLNMKLGAIKRTIMELNKDIIFPDIVVFRFQFGPANQFAYSGSSGTDPSAGVLDLISAAFLAPAPAITAEVVIYNLEIQLAIEKNEDLAQVVRRLVNSDVGLNILVDYPHVAKQNLNAINQNISLRFNRGHGRNLLGVIVAPFNATEKNNTAYDCYNVVNAGTSAAYTNGGATGGVAITAAKVTEYKSSLDTIDLQGSTVKCGLFQAGDYRENKRHLENSAYLDARVYNNSWFHYDKFYESNLVNNHLEQNLDRGLSLIVERKYDFMATCIDQNLNWLTVGLAQKDLHIGANMISYQ